MDTKPENKDSKSSRPDMNLLLSDILGARVLSNGKKIGSLSDMVIVETGKFPEVTQIVVTRPFGNPSLIVPWDQIKPKGSQGFEIGPAELRQFEKDIPDDAILLRDHILDKKVLDIEDAEVEVVYDIHLLEKNGKLYVTEVDTSRSARLRRLGLGLFSGTLHRNDTSKDDGIISWTYLQPLPPHLGSFKGNVKLNILKEKLAEIHPVDMADILEELDHDQRVMVFSTLEDGHASETLEEVEPAVQRDIISSLSKDKIVPLINDMTPGQAADILSVLPSADAHDILDSMNAESARKVQAIMNRQEEKVFHYTTQKILKFPPDTTVEYVQNDYPRHARDKDVIMYIYVTGEQDILLGVIDLKELLKADDKAMLREIMVENVIALSTESTLKEASQVFARYDFRALPVVDGENRLVGVIPYRDVMNLTHHFIE